MLYPQSSHKQKEPDYNMLQLELNNTNINIKNAVIYYTQFLSDQPNSEKSYERSLDHLEKKCGLVLTDNQRRAILQSIVENHNLSKEEKRFCRDIFNKAGRKKEKGSKNPLIRHLKNPTTGLLDFKGPLLRKAKEKSLIISLYLTGALEGVSNIAYKIVGDLSHHGLSLLQLKIDSLDATVKKAKDVLHTINDTTSGVLDFGQWTAETVQEMLGRLETYVDVKDYQQSTQETITNIGEIRGSMKSLLQIVDYSKRQLEQSKTFIENTHEVVDSSIFFLQCLGLTYAVWGIGRLYKKSLIDKTIDIKATHSAVVISLCMYIVSSLVASQFDYSPVLQYIQETMLDPYIETIIQDLPELPKQ